VFEHRPEGLAKRKSDFCMRARNPVILMLAFAIAIPAMPGWDARAVGLDLDSPGRASVAVKLPRDRVADRDSLLAQSGNPLWAVPLGELHATRDRPIFSASRRPPSPPAVFASVAPAAPPKPVPQLPDRPPLVLLGTIIGGSLRVGIFHEQTTTKTVRLNVGESHDRWVLRSVSASDARFETPDQGATLVLRPAAQLAMKGDPAPEPPVAVVARRKRNR
jgi:hypothetical protein